MEFNFHRDLTCKTELHLPEGRQTLQAETLPAPSDAAKGPLLGAQLKAGAYLTAPSSQHTRAVNNRHKHMQQP